MNRFHNTSTENTTEGYRHSRWSQHAAPVLREDDTLDRYLLLVRHEAHQGTDPEQAEAITAEVESHLRENVAAQIADGITPVLAAREAIRGFGDPVRFVRSVVAQGYETRFSATARAIALLACALCALTCAYLLIICWPNQDYENSLQHIQRYGLLGVLVASFLGRRLQLRQYAPLLTGILLATMLFTGFDHIDVRSADGSDFITLSRLQLPETITQVQRNQREAERYADLLKTGNAFYSTLLPKSPIAQEYSLQSEKGKVLVYKSQNGRQQELVAVRPIPTTLLQDGKFIVPRFRQVNETFHDLRAFSSDNLPVTMRNGEALLHYKEREHSYRMSHLLTEPVPGNALFRWEKATEWLKIQPMDLKSDPNLYEAAERAPLAFSLMGAMSLLPRLFPMYLALLCMHVLGAASGGALARWWRRYLWRLRATR